VSTKRIAVLISIMLAFGLLVGSTSAVVAQESDATPKPLPVPRAEGWEVVGCRTLFVDNPGTYKVGVPRWCRNGRCEIFVEWWGEPIGAFDQGFTWAINYIEYPDQNNLWNTGPVVSIAGATLGGGWGNNGDSWDEVIHGGGQTTGGDYFYLLDDSWVERKPNQASFVLHQENPGDPEILAARLFICKG